MIIQNQPNQMAAVWINGSLTCVIEPTFNALPYITAALSDIYPHALDIVVYGRDFKADREKIGILAQIHYQYQKDVVEIELTWITNRNNRFPNGFDNWHETHFHCVTGINNELHKSEPCRLVEDTHEAEGLGGLWNLALEMTNEFENAHANVQWGIDTETCYLDAVDEFIENKFKA